MKKEEQREERDAVVRYLHRQLPAWETVITEAPPFVDILLIGPEHRSRLRISDDFFDKVKADQLEGVLELFQIVRLLRETQGTVYLWEAGIGIERESS